MIARRGLSLIELLVVLSLMSMVAAAGISLLGEWDDSRRDEETLIQLQAVRRAVLGPEVHSTQLIGRGFLQDMGFLPWDGRYLYQSSLPDDEDIALPLSAMYGINFFPDGSVVAEAREQNTSYDLLMLAGWRGPYLSPALAADDDDLVLIDGWGNNLHLVDKESPDGSAAWPSAGILVNRQWESQNPRDNARRFPRNSDPLFSAHETSLPGHDLGTITVSSSSAHTGLSIAVIVPRWQVTGNTLTMTPVVLAQSEPFDLPTNQGDQQKSIILANDPIPVGHRHLVLRNASNALLAQQTMVIHPQFTPSSITITIP